MQTAIRHLTLIVSLLEWSVRLANAAGWFFPEYPPIVEFGQYNPNDVICFHKKILDGTHSPQLIHFRHPLGAKINYIKLKTTQDGWAGFRAELTEGATGTSFVQLEVYATYSWWFFRTDVYIDMHCTPVSRAYSLFIGGRKRPELTATSTRSTAATKRTGTVFWV